MQRAHAGGRGIELPPFVKLAVVRQVRFRYQTQQLPVADDGGTVVELSVHRDRQSHEGHEVKVRACLEHGGEPSCCGTLERLLEKQVAAGIAGQSQLGKDRQLHAIRRCVLHGGDGLLRVERAVGHAQRGRDGAGFEKTVDHDVITLSKKQSSGTAGVGRTVNFQKSQNPERKALRVLRMLYHTTAVGGRTSGGMQKMCAGKPKITGFVHSRRRARRIPRP